MQLKQKTSDFVACYQTPNVNEFIALRNQVGWTSPRADVVATSLANSLFIVSVYQQTRLVASGRVVGDKAMFFYIQDVIVLPELQGFGLGQRIMDEIERYLADVVTSGATVGLMAAQGKEGFYRKYHYLERTGEPLGLGMCKFIP
ncbi:GNAT family N-acetyltransferase [Pseudoalteromonas fenneropenaei]|uniref:GNAT family N-acetyltransferase n=1 Tax=Pseudoalteromonas fenneropenaei TaxID=1737459 RepID=A0ABV7CFK6_9GAMM